MNTLLLCSGIRGKQRGLDCLRRAVETRRPAGVLFAGGVLALERCYEAKISNWGMTREDALFAERFFETLGELGVFSAVIPGAGDTPLEEFLRLGMHAEVEYPEVSLAHATLITRNGLAVTGLGGWVSEGAACEVDCCPRSLARYYLRSLAAANQPHKVLLLARPPAGPSDSDGSVLSAELIDSLHPSLCVAGDAGEGASVRRVVHTLVVNPGSLSEGRAAWLDWRLGAADRVELLDEHTTLFAAAAPSPAGRLPSRH
jgi:Icc-related predicted phosphoesterase